MLSIGSRQDGCADGACGPAFNHLLPVQDVEGKRDKSLSAAAPDVHYYRHGRVRAHTDFLLPIPFWETGDSPPPASQQSEGTLIPEP